jgi:hypothetical protein
VANDYGRLSARDRARLKAARRRAGIRDSVTVTDVTRQQSRRDQGTRDFPTAKPIVKPKTRLATVQAERDAKLRTRPTPNKSGFRDAADVMGGIALMQDPRGFVHAMKEITRFSRESKDTLMDPEASFREKLGAAGNVAVVGGASGVGRPRRSLTVNEKTQQLPRARSKFTQKVIEDPADRVSAALMGEGKIASAARRVLPTAAAEARVAKAAGRQQLVRQSRAAAPQQRHLRALPKEGSPEDVAHFWWAQLPKSERNVQGLQRVRAAQARELEEITSERALTALRAQRQTEEVKALISDLPLRVNDLSLSLAQLDAVIARPPKLQSKVIDAVQSLSKDRRAIHEATDQLKPERADAREGLVSRWLGLEPTGEELYVGHRLQRRMSGANPGGLPVSVGTGRVRTPQGIATENKLVLAKSGRLRASTHTAADDWRASQVFRSSSIARDDLGAVGKPFRGTLDPKTQDLINPKGRPVPPTMKTDKLARLADEGADVDDLRRAADDIVRSYMARDEEGVRAMLEAAAREGVSWDELRVVPKKTTERYFGQFKPAGRSTGAMGVYDTAVDFTAASIIFARLGYIPKNIVQNLILAVPHQGPRIFANLPRASQILADPELRPIFQAEVGHTGATGAVGNEFRARGLPAKAANAVSKVSDDPLRMTAIVHELANEGVIPKWKPLIDDADKAKLLEVYRNPQHEPLVNDVRSRGVEAMADFSRLTPAQRKAARRFLVIPGWLWAGSRYPFHFAATHPGRAAAIAYVAAGEPGMGKHAPNKPITDYMADGLPHYISGVDTGDGKLMRTNSLNPVSTPWEIAGAVAGRSPRTAADYANPLAASLINTADKTVDSSRGPYRVDSYREAGGKNAERLVPNIDFLRDLIHPPKDPGIYTEDSSRAGRVKRELGVVPIKIDREEAATAKARIEGGRPSHVKDHETRMNTLRAELKKRGRDTDMNAVKASRAIRGMDLAKRQAEKKNGGDKLTSEQKARLALRTYKRINSDRAGYWTRRFEHGVRDQDEWQKHYEKIREEIARPFKRYGVNMDGSESKG